MCFGSAQRKNKVVIRDFSVSVAKNGKKKATLANGSMLFKVPFRGFRGLNIKPEVHNVAIFHYIGFSFNT